MKRLALAGLNFINSRQLLPLDLFDDNYITEVLGRRDQLLANVTP
jgi:hypothetical protein